MAAITGGELRRSSASGPIRPRTCWCRRRRGRASGMSMEGTTDRYTFPLFRLHRRRRVELWRVACSAGAVLKETI